MIRCMPVLQVADVKRSERFYCEKLGFQTLGTWGDGPDFGIVQHGRVTIALDQSRGGEPIPRNQYWAAYVYVEDADTLSEQLRGNGVEILRGPEDMPYGSRDFDIRDPDGHLLAFGHDLDRGDLKSATTENRKALYSGGCQCGARRYALYAEPYRAHLCHCRMCQKAVGGPFAALASVKLSDFSWTRGAPAVFPSSPESARGFCPDCGTPLTIQDLNADRINFTIASLDNPAGVVPEFQMGIESRQPWFEALPGLPPHRTEDLMTAEQLAGIENFQHPDCDTEVWPPER